MNFPFVPLPATFSGMSDIHFLVGLIITGACVFIGLRVLVANLWEGKKKLARLGFLLFGIAALGATLGLYLAALAVVGVILYCLYILIVRNVVYTIRGKDDE